MSEKQYMVTYDQIASIFNKRKNISDGCEKISFGADCYEAGMVEVLSHVAKRELETEYINPKNSETTFEMVEMKYKDLTGSFSTEENLLLEEYHQLFERFSTEESIHYFVEGFISGYRFLKDMIVHTK